MEILQCFFLITLFCTLFPAFVIRAQDNQPGFISIDCGLPENSDYIDSVTGIHYTSDSGFIDSGVSKTTTSKALEQQYLNVRSFPEGTRNCYTLKPDQGIDGIYMIRASFVYGNYDGENKLPKFDLYIGVEYWSTIVISDALLWHKREIIHIPSSDYINVCLVKVGTATPFISTLELRTLNKTMYKNVTQFASLSLYTRINFSPTTDQVIRYKDDVFDRVWTPQTLPNTTNLSTKSIINNNLNDYELPSVVMSTASTTKNPGDQLLFSWDTPNKNDIIYLYMYFAELQELKPNETREFNIYVNDAPFYEGYVPDYLSTRILFSTHPGFGVTEYVVIMNKTVNSTLPPIVNAVEVFTLLEFSLSQTFSGDVNAMQSIKSTYDITSNWQGDPCAPEDFVWDGVTCNPTDGFNPRRVISLNLSSNGLNGEIASSLSNLTVLQSLDLSNNNLTGLVPDFLAEMATIQILKLEGNNFQMPLPPKLLEKVKQGKLQLSFDDPNNKDNKNLDSCNSDSCKKKKNNIVIIIAAVVGAVLFLVFALLIVLCMFRKRKQKAIKKVETHSNKNEGFVESREMQYMPTRNETIETYNDDYIVDSKSRKFRYHEVVSMTNNFERVIGKGGFGTVYHGYVGDTQVAVKMLSESSSQGYKEFQSEANLLLTIHHRNLTSLVGYCYESTNMGIIYEYMANGNVEKHLLGKSHHVLTWEERLYIAIDAGQGLEYLHHGCVPPVVHRDIKTTNILLDEKFQAKLADFGLSRAYPVENGTHISTIVAGTPGYLDPEYYMSGRLTEKSDIYSFGIVLLEIVTGRSALPKNNDEVHITTWIGSELEKGDIENIIDPRLRKRYTSNSVWKLVELAMACVARNPGRRPTMNFVVVELKACLAIEMSRNEAESKDSTGEEHMSLDSGFGPQAR